jgi:hypothetical protein
MNAIEVILTYTRVKVKSSQYFEFPYEEIILEQTWNLN